MHPGEFLLSQVRKTTLISEPLGTMKLLVLALASLFLVSSADDKGPLFNIMKVIYRVVVIINSEFINY